MDIKPLSRREQLERLAAQTVRQEQMARIKAMTRDEKYAELGEFYQVAGHLKLDIDVLKADQVAQGLPDSVLDQAIAILWALAGKTVGKVPMSSKELKDHLPANNYVRMMREHWSKLRGAAAPSFSLRKGGEVKLGNLKKPPDR